MYLRLQDPLACVTTQLRICIQAQQPYAHVLFCLSRRAVTLQCNSMHLWARCGSTASHSHLRCPKHPKICWTFKLRPASCSLSPVHLLFSVVNQACVQQGMLKVAREPHGLRRFACTCAWSRDHATFSAVSWGLKSMAAYEIWHSRY